MSFKIPQSESTNCACQVHRYQKAKRQIRSKINNRTKTFTPVQWHDLRISFHGIRGFTERSLPEVSPATACAWLRALLWDYYYSTFLLSWVWPLCQIMGRGLRNNPRTLSRWLRKWKPIWSQGRHAWQSWWGRLPSRVSCLYFGQVHVVLHSLGTYVERITQTHVCQEWGGPSCGSRTWCSFSPWKTTRSSPPYWAKSLASWR